MQAKHILKIVTVLFLMTQFYNAPSDFATLPRGRRALTIAAHIFVQKNGKRILFSQNWSDNDDKKV